MRIKEAATYYTIDSINYRVFEETDKKLVIENFLDDSILSLYGDGEFFSIDITENILTLEKYDNNNYSFEENIKYLLLYYNDIKLEMFESRTLHIHYKNENI